MKADTKIFLRFLKKKKIYRHYFDTVKRNKNRISTINIKYHGNIKEVFNSDMPSTSYIDKTIVWINTAEGLLFWKNLSEEYIEYYHSLVNKH